MKYILSVIVLVSCTYCFPLFHCFKAAHEHTKLKESRPANGILNPLANTDSFLDQGNNKSKTLSLSLSSSNHHPQRMFIREVPHKEFHQSGTWTLEIVDKDNTCLEISKPNVKSPSGTQEPFVFSWELIPKTKGTVIVRTTYTSASRKPYSQQFMIHVEA